ncbi:PH domain-containing protein [Levilactobacillus spicheri]|uniref:Membrane protein n=2 Tax=Levilactobacillus spicheri TaxID=216463 RepID=A0A0F3RV80_9LACO|nr:PH domain-containing protein [Levilactobacillus spicheri]KJW12692.1 membrane protein [Levilactobacillus spicheri]KRL47617.1 hypothetical protein FD37_GL001876 [Levilactobacillus spicheri DSM 15429]GEO67196.1 membrane protein [Levilactobacillus spicheri]
MQTTTQSLPPRIKRIWGYSALGSFLALLVITGLLWLAHTYWHWTVWLAVFGGILTVIEPTIEAALIPYRYRFSRYQITSLAVEIQSGWLFKKRVAIPIARVQNVTLNAGPLLQWQHLTQVTVATAATSHTIEGLELDVAAQLREQIMRLAQEARHDPA